MCAAVSLREFIIERLTAAAADIFSACEQTIVRYEEEIDRQRRLLEISLKPQVTESSSSTSTGKPAKLYESTHPDWAPSLQLGKDVPGDGKRPLSRCKRPASRKDVQQRDATKKRTCANVELQNPEPCQKIANQREPGPLEVKEEPEDSNHLQITAEHALSQTEQNPTIKVKEEPRILLQPRVVLHRLDIFQYNTQKKRSHANLNNRESESVQAKKKQKEPAPAEIKEEQLDWNSFQTKEDHALEKPEQCLLDKIKEEDDNWEYEQVALKEETDPTPICERGDQRGAVTWDETLSHNLAEDQRRYLLADSGCTRTEAQMIHNPSLMNSSNKNSETMSISSDADLSSLTSETEGTSISDVMEDTRVTSESDSGSVSVGVSCLKCNICEKHKKVSKKGLTEKTHSSEKWRLCHRCEEWKGLINDHTYYVPLFELQMHQGNSTDSCEYCGHHY